MMQSDPLVNTFNTTGDLTMGPIDSPRTKYLINCMNRNLNPRAALVLRKNLTKRLDLPHYGIGDESAQLLAESLRGLPYIEAINIRDNRLTDDGMGPILLAAVEIPGLKELNVSQNKIDPISSQALFDYIISPTCPLERLIMISADVDDFECANFVEAIKENRSLTELDLSGNLIGGKENLNTVMPDVTTGSEALADLLRMPTCKLKILKLEWNMIRLDGAIDLASSIAINNNLMHLDLSYNAIGNGGGITIGTSILKNTALETLILQNNGLDSVACFTICAGIIENRGLKKVVLDGNPIGQEGMRALMLIPLVVGNRVKVTAARCNISIRNPKCWFNFEKLLRDYELDMSNGFERAIAIIILHVIAGHSTFIFSSFVHETYIRKKLKKVNVELTQGPSYEKANYFNLEQKKTIKLFSKFIDAAADIRTAITLFQEVDRDGSGGLDIDEIGDVLEKMGFKLSEKRLREIFKRFDIDNNGILDISEFLGLIKVQREESIARLKEMKESPVMVLASDESVRYLPPEIGKLHITVINGFARKKMYRVMTSCDQELLNEIADNAGSNATAMVAASLEGMKLRLDEGLTLVTKMLEDNPDKTAVLKQVVLKMNNFNDAYNLVMSTLDGDRAEMLRLKKEMGLCMRVIMGNLNGYYILDLGLEMDRLCMEKLIEISATYNQIRQEQSKIGFGRVGDVSQKGNWTCFRNEHYNREPIIINSKFASPLPSRGKVEFDFSGGGRPKRDDRVMTDIRLLKLLANHQMLNQNDIGPALYKLRINQKLAERTLGSNGITHLECPIDRMRKIGEYVEIFYSNLTARMKMFEESKKIKEATEEMKEGELVDLFERDKSERMSSYIGEYLRELNPLTLDAKTIKIMNQNRASTTSISSSFDLAKDPKGGKKSKKKNRRDSTKSIATEATTKSKKSVSASSKSTPMALSSMFGRKKVDENIVVDNRTPLAKALDNLDAVLETDDEDNEGSSSEDSDSSFINQKRTMVIEKVKHEEGSIRTEEDDEIPQDDELQFNWMKELELLKSAMVKKPEKKKEEVIVYNRRKNIGTNPSYLKLLWEKDEFLIKFKDQLDSKSLLTIGGKAQKLIDLLEDAFARHFIYARHLSLILECFVEYGYIKQTKFFGTYRVDLAISLFARVVDLHNFEFVLEVLSPFEVACFYCRIGWLNVYNPCKPEGSWELDLSRREERIVAKTLCCLATSEPGDNWTYQTFRWMRSMDSMPGWELTQPWLTETGMPMRGLVNITYYSGEGKMKKGCRPYVSYRKSLLNLVLINEDEIVKESMRSKPPPAMLPGDKALQRHSNLWETYLAPAFVDPKRKR